MTITDFATRNSSSRYRPFCIRQTSLLQALVLVQHLQSMPGDLSGDSGRIYRKPTHLMGKKWFLVDFPSKNTSTDQKKSWFSMWFRPF
jgi:hypothetical protein